MTVLRVIYRGSYQPEMIFSMSMRGLKNLLIKNMLITKYRITGCQNGHFISFYERSLFMDEIFKTMQEASDNVTEAMNRQEPKEVTLQELARMVSDEIGAKCVLDILESAFSILEKQGFILGGV